MTLRWGIASAGKISNDFVSSLQVLSKTDHEIVSVAARSLSSAQTFAQKHNIPKYYEGYIKLAEDEDVNIVYIGTLNPQHFEVAKIMLDHGKHVLCEKPFTMNERQTRQLIELAKLKKLFLAEAVWSRSFPVYTELAKLLQSGAIGEVLYVQVSFGLDLQKIPRLTSKEMGGGTILDLGVYVLQLQQFVFRGMKPTEVLARGELNVEGTDNAMATIITYPNGKFALLNTSSRVALCNEAIVIGTKGIIRIPEFWCPTKLITPNETLQFPLPTSSGQYNFHNSVGLSYQAEVIKRCIDEGKLESPNITHDESIQLANLMDSLRKQIGVVFPDDLQ